MDLNVFSELFSNGQEAQTGDIDRDLNGLINFHQSENNVEAVEAFRGIQNEKESLFSGFKTNVLDYYDRFEDLTNPSFQEFLSTRTKQAREFIPRIQEQSKEVREKFGPNGEFAGKANAYFSDLIKTVNSNISGQEVAGAAAAKRAGAGRIGINNSVNQVRKDLLPQLTEVRKAQMDSMERLYKDYVGLTTDLRAEEIAASDKFIVDPIIALAGEKKELGKNIISALTGLDSQEVAEILASKSHDRNVELTELSGEINERLARTQGNINQDYQSFVNSLSQKDGSVQFDIPTEKDMTGITLTETTADGFVLDSNGNKYYENNGKYYDASAKALFDTPVTPSVMQGAIDSVTARKGEKVQCGMLVNDYFTSQGIGGLWMGDTLASKNAVIQKLGRAAGPVAGGVFTKPGGVLLANGQDSGHTGIIQSFDPTTGTITVLEANSAKQGGGAAGTAPGLQTYTVEERQNWTFSNAPEKKK